MSSSSRRIARGGAERTADLEPMYLALHEHHAKVILANADAIRFYERRGMLAVARVYMRSIGERGSRAPIRLARR